MPRRKPSSSSHHSNHSNSKARTHELADGWTQIIRGPPPRSPGLSTPHPVAPAQGTTLETLSDAYKKAEVGLLRSPFWLEVRDLVLRRVLPLMGADGEMGERALGGGDGVEQEGGDSVEQLSTQTDSTTLTAGHPSDSSPSSSSATATAAVQEAPTGSESKPAANTDADSTTLQPPTPPSNALDSTKTSQHPQPRKSQSTTTPFHNIVLLALGSPSHPSREISRVANIQLAFANAFLALLQTHGLLAAKAPRIVQDPAFNALDKRFLTSQGWRVLDVPRGEEMVGRDNTKGGKGDGSGEGNGTVLVAPHLEEGVLKGILERWKVEDSEKGQGLGSGKGIMVGNDLGMVEERLGCGGRTGLSNSGGGGKEENRWWEGWERNRPVAAGDPVGAREWFGVSVHWRGLG